MGTVVSRLGFIVILMKNKNGGDGHFMISPESNHVYPIDLNADRLPIIRRAGVTSARPSAPDTLWEVVKRLSNVATARDRRLSAKSSQAEAFLHSALSESASQATYTPHAYMATAVAHAASGALPDTDTSSSDGSDLESEPEVSSEEAAHMRLAAMKASRKNHKWPDAKPKSRARTAPVVHIGYSIGVPMSRIRPWHSLRSGSPETARPSPVIRRRRPTSTTRLARSASRHECWLRAGAVRQCAASAPITPSEGAPG